MSIYLLMLFKYFDLSLQEPMYCGAKNCYDILNISITATKSEIQRSFRKLSLKLHPDKNTGEDSLQKYQVLVRAYEILKDEESRNDYNYYLEHPEEYYYNMYRYYRKNVQIDIRIVIISSLIIFSYIQYYMLQTRHLSILEAAFSNPKCRNWALQRMYDEHKTDLPSKNSRIYEELIKKYIALNVDSKHPVIRDLICIQILFFPISLIRQIFSEISWHFKYTILRFEYNDSAKEFLTKNRLKLTDSEWNKYDTNLKNELVNKHLWIKINYDKYFEEINDDYHRNCLKSAKYKSLKRWLRKGGPGTMTFAED